jgi:competence protein ComGC
MEDKSNVFNYYKILLPIFIFFVLWIALSSSTHRASDKALDVSCRSNLKNINKALNSYYLDNNVYPNELKTLVDLGYLKGYLLKCPLANIQGGLFSYTCKDMRKGSDYNYTRQNINKVHGILCWDKDNNHAEKDVPNMKNVLFNDGYIGSYPVEIWEKKANDYMLHGD